MNMNSSSSNPQSMAASTPTDDSGKKVRKPYTITKSRESWTDEEHDKFLEALQLFDRDWKKIEDFVGSKSVIQIRSHAQKYFLKVQKNGTTAHVPPPRPKRKATHPYPQKASKTDLVSLQASMAYTSTLNCLAPGYSPWHDTAMLINTKSSRIMPSQDEFTNLLGVEDDIRSKGVAWVGNNSISGIESSSGTLLDSEIPKTRRSRFHSACILDTCSHVNVCPIHLSYLYCCRCSPQHYRQNPGTGVPDFAEVYTFIGSVFDPDTKGHVQKLKQMDPINFETVLLLMRNLTINLSSSDFEPIVKHRYLSALQGKIATQLNVTAYFPLDMGLCMRSPLYPVNEIGNGKVLSSFEINRKTVEGAAGSVTKHRNNDQSC
ncbi:hypothetical protein HHK36_018266 [Tetracentron sinense]|uniref:Uncharacterized protein n=1 Tax=Tetracentron sinense TaxID=13715 RepID=A0A834YYF4_TETSI|nr:hypothetical protein HHK36_018266 [Tetracentron sinense]